MVESLISAARGFLSANVIVSFLLIVLLLVAFVVMRKLVHRHLDTIKTSGDHADTRVQVVTNIYTVARYLLLFIVVLAILDINGIDITALAAAAGVAGIILGFALQDVLSDLAMGMRIVTDNYFSVGQVIKVGTLEGTVLAISPQSVKVRSIVDDSVTTISNRLLTQVEVLGELVDVDVPLSYEVPAPEAQRILEDIAARVRELEAVSDSQFKGTQAFEDSDILYRVRFWCPPQVRYQTLRDTRRIIQDVLVENGQSIPYPQVDVRVSP